MNRITWDDRGSAATELALITPVLIVLLLFAVNVGRVASARSDVQAAARDAARAASIARSPATAITDGEQAARASLHAGGVTCRTLTIAVDTSTFHAGGTVRATVSCTVELDALTGLTTPGSKTMSSTFLAPIDGFRGVS